MKKMPTCQNKNMALEGRAGVCALFPFLEGRVMEWYTFGLDKMLMFIFATSSAMVIVLTVMFLKSVIEKGPKKYVEMN